LSWSYLGGWVPEEYFLKIHPVWMGSSINLLTIILVTIFDRQASWYFKNADGITYFSAEGGLLLTLINIWNFELFYENGLFGLFLFAAILCFFIVTIRVFHSKEEKPSKLSTVSNM